MTIKDVKIILLSSFIFFFLWSVFVLFLNLYPVNQPSKIKDILITDENLIIIYDYIDNDISSLDIYQDNKLIASFYNENIKKNDKNIIINLDNFIFIKNKIYELNIDFGNGWDQCCMVLIDKNLSQIYGKIIEQRVCKQH